MLALVNCDIFDGVSVLYEHAVLIDGPFVNAVVQLEDVPESADPIDLGGRSVAPGFIDVQVNGGGGMLLTTTPTVEAIECVAAAHLAYGTTHMLPTFITAPVEVFIEARRSVNVLLEAGHPGVLGVHFEGPFLNPAKAGIHDAAAMRQPDERDLAWIAGDGITLLTVAPEMVSSGWLARFRAAGALLSAGHTTATYSQMQDAFAAGVTATTHLYNAMRNMESREPGVVGASLASERTWCSLIADGFHVDPATIRVAWQAKTLGTMLLITDAMPPVGSDIERFTIGAHEVFLRDGRCATADGTLAGSNLDMASAVRTMIQRVGISKDEALRMASTYPARYLGLADSLGRIAAGYRADLAIFDNEIHVSAVVHAGRLLDVAEMPTPADISARHDGR